MKPAAIIAEAGELKAAPGAKAGAAERVAVASPVGDGRHHARWPDGSEYFGEWRGGRAHGRGAFVWPSGALLEAVLLGMMTCQSACLC